MSNIPISSLPVAVALTGGEYVPLVQAGTTFRATVSQFNAANPANLPIGGLPGQALVKQSVANYDTTWRTVSGLGTVQEIDTGTGIAGGPITTIGTISLAAIAPGTVLSNILGGISQPVPNTPSQVLDVIGSQQGDILYRSATGWNTLPPSTSSFVLTTNGFGANPSWGPAGSGTVQSVGLSLPGIFTVSGSPVTVTGTLAGALATQSANQVWAGPTTGSASAPTFRALAGADLPNPSASTLGGIQSAVSVSHQWINSISTSGVPALSQPAFTDISGTVAASQLPNPSPTTLGGIESLAAVTSKWINQISTSGVPSATQPAFSDISGNLSNAQLPPIGNNTIISNVSGSSGTPLPNTLSAIIDSGIGSTQGDILYRDTATWSVLAPGTSGQALTSGGTAANPSWQTVTGTGTVTSVASGTGLTGGPITVSGTLALANIGGNTVLANISGGSSVPIPTTPTAILDVIGATEGDVLYRGASTWSALAPGTSGQYLKTSGAGSTPVWSSPVTSIVAGTGLSGGTITTTGTIALSTARQTLPTTQVFLSGTGTYTAPANCLWIEVELVGGGAGGNGSGSTGATVGVLGGNTTFGAFTAGGAPAPASQVAAGAGGTASGGYFNKAGGAGGPGSAATTPNPGSPGGSSAYGGFGQGGVSGAGAGGAASANSGAGGGGGGANTTPNSGAGGGAGGFVRGLVSSPTTISYGVGAGGAGGSAGSGGAVGGAGAAGAILVVEHYGS